MALGVGSTVALSVQCTAFSYANAAGLVLNPTAPLFGKLTAYAAPNATVVWANSGLSQATVSDTTFDEILALLSPTTLIGNKVRVANQNVALDMVVIAAYQRKPIASAGFDVALCAVLSLPGVFRELLISSIEQVAG